jgi:hypothetical protein
MIDDLFKQQSKLQKDASLVLVNLDLLPLLKKYGDPKIVGSMALELMTWRDIDIEIIVGELDKKVIAEVIEALVIKTVVRIDITFTDNRFKFGLEEKIPKSLYIGLKYFGEDIPPGEMLGANPKAWKLDLHFIMKEDARGGIKTTEIASKLTDENRRIILEIKEVVAENPQHRKQIFSLDIYKAVLDHGVKNLEDFQSYLARDGRAL